MPGDRIIYSSPCFALGVLREVVESEPGEVEYRRYWGSAMGLRNHVSAAIACGLVSWSDGEDGDVYSVLPTEFGKDFYRRHALGSWPKGRAYAWPLDKSPLREAVREVQDLADWESP
jgi:hypothetical protein